MQKETRTLSFENLSAEEMVLEGYAAVFDAPTVLYKYDGNEYKEIIHRDAFNATNFKDCCLKYNHESGVPILARTRGGSLQLSTDSRGLFFRAKLFDTQAARDVYTLVKGGALDKCSFAFTIADDGALYDKATRTRTITNVEKCWDCSVVDTPAYETTTVQARSFFEAEAEKERAEARNALELAKAKYYYGGIK